MIEGGHVGQVNTAAAAAKLPHLGGLAMARQGITAAEGLVLLRTSRSLGVIADLVYQSRGRGPASWSLPAESPSGIGHN
jgi:hypothetical protein